jgi:hypothetical protein
VRDGSEFRKPYQICAGISQSSFWGSSRSTSAGPCTRVAHAFSAESVISLLLAIAFILLALYSRMFALTVQDRVIRLEMRLRMQQVLPGRLACSHS